MKFSIEMFNKHEFDNIHTIYHNIPSNFEKSININPQFNNEIEEVYNRALLNLGRSLLSIFNLKFLEMFEELSRYYENDDKLFELSKSIIKIFDSYFKELNDNLYLKTEKDFDQLKFILEISLITLEEIVEDKNIELVYEAFFQIERRMEKENLYVHSKRFIKEGVFEVNLLLDESNVDYNDFKSEVNLVMKNGLSNS